MAVSQRRKVGCDTAFDFMAFISPEDGALIMDMERISSITSADNERIRLYRRLSDDRKTRKKEKMFVLEGARLVSDAAREKGDIRCVFFTREAAEKYPAAMELLFSAYNKRIFHIITRELADTLSDTEMPQGIFAVCAQLEKDKDISYKMIPERGTALILDGIQDPGNMGTLLRTADACGTDAVILCSCCDIYNPKTVRSAMGSIMRVNIITDTVQEAVKRMKERDISVYAAVTDGDALSLTECDFSGGGAVMIGNEGSGLSRESAALADKRLTIKMHGRVNSLNAAMAAGIIMWELSKRGGGL